MLNSITVILPVYNGMKYLDFSIKSVLQQTCREFEFLIIDDCSTDGSWEYLTYLKDSRVRVFNNSKNRGLFYCLNFLITKSTGKYIKLWAQDDYMYPDCLNRIIEFHSINPGIGFSYSGRDHIDDKGEMIPNSNIDNTPTIIYRELHNRIAFSVGSIAGNIANVTLSRESLKKVGLFNEDMKISGDFEMWIRLAKYYPIGFIREPLVQLRNHKGQLSQQSAYYIFHLKEDIISYNYLFSYISEKERKEGKFLLRNHKLLFYFTLMVKAFLKGDFKTTTSFFRALYKFDNILVLSFYFIYNKVIFGNRGIHLAESNTEFNYLFFEGS